jgi:FkbM family methyltransferase
MTRLRNTPLRTVVRPLASAVKTLFKSCGYTIVATNDFTISPRVPSATLHPLALASELLCRKGRTPFVVQVGACDGVLGDPLYEIITARGLDALLVEPIPESAMQLRRNYEPFPNARVAECAVVEKDGPVLMYRVGVMARYGEWSWQWSSVNRAHLLKHGVEPQDIFTVEVQGCTLKTVMANHDISKCDILQVDTEGFDDVVVRMALELPEPPTIIHFEYVHLASDRHLALLAGLSERGYKWLHMGLNTLAMQI